MSEKREWTAERHAAAWDRCNRATSGPWKWWTSNSHRRLTAEDRQDGGVAYGTKCRDGCGDIVISETDMAFIEEARLDLPDALREIERLSRSEAACIREALEQVGVARAERDEARVEVERLKADLLLLGALKSAEVAPVIERFREAFGADVPQAPGLTDDRLDLLLSEAAAIVGMQGPPEMKRAALRGSLLMVCSQPAKGDPPVRRARHDRHCLIHDGVGCSREPGCEVEE